MKSILYRALSEPSITEVNREYKILAHSPIGKKHNITTLRTQCYTRFRAFHIYEVSQKGGGGQSRIPEKNK